MWPQLTLLSHGNGKRHTKSWERNIKLIDMDLDPSRGEEDIFLQTYPTELMKIITSTVEEHIIIVKFLYYIAKFLPEALKLYHTWTNKFSLHIVSMT